MAQPIALRALGKTRMKPSPWFFTSKPPWRRTRSAMIPLWVRSSRIQARSPSRSVRTVEFSMSLNMIVTVPSGAAAGRSP
jgi:hypothetical protein